MLEIRPSTGMLSSNFCWFVGVVEDINDPKMQDRVRVRIHGIHSDKTVVEQSTGKGIPPGDLPWSKVVSSPSSPRIHGFGMNHGLLEGSWVFGFSIDGDAFNDIYIVGSMPGVPEDLNPNPKTPPAAFFGQDGQWPLKEYLNEPDVSRLARNDLKYNDASWKPIPLIKIAEAVNGIPTATGQTWNEMPPAFAPQYPWNQVREGPNTTTIGHTEEWDSTPGAERITLWHGPSHSYRDYHVDGSRQTKIVGNDYEIVLQDKNLYVKGNLNITAVGEVNIYSQGSTTVKSDTSITCEAGTSATVSANTFATVEALGAATVRAGLDATVQAGGSATIEAGLDVNVQAAGEASVSALGLVNVTAGIGVDVLATAFVNITAPVITLVGEVIAPGI